MQVPADVGADALGEAVGTGTGASEGEGEAEADGASPAEGVALGDADASAGDEEDADGTEEAVGADDVGAAASEDDDGAAPPSGADAVQPVTASRSPIETMVPVQRLFPRTCVMRSPYVGGGLHQPAFGGCAAIVTRPAYSWW